jgi:uncharacterized protein
VSELVLLDGAASSASPSDDQADQKASLLTERLRNLGSAIVAFSGGVDSAYLALIATRVLGSHALAVTADSPSYPQRHRALATRIAREFSFNHEFIVTHELERPEYRANHADRCYHCKNELFTELTTLARERGFRFVLDGNNADDRGDYRPGRQAAREFGVLSPLDEVGLRKSEIRELARRVGLPVWNEPASACLSSRIPYESEVTEAKLQVVEQAEAVLGRLGFRVYRVRHHDEVARIELAREEMPRALEPEVNAILVRELKALGYRFVALDLQGYRLGSLNESLKLRPV